MHERPPTPHFLRFVRALAFVTGAAGSVSACASTAGPSDGSDAPSPYDGASHGIGPSIDAGISTMPDVYDGASTGIDAWVDTGTDAANPHDGAIIGVVVMVDSGHD